VLDAVAAAMAAFDRIAADERTDVLAAMMVVARG
jgi:hypothetical protein